MISTRHLSNLNQFDISVYTGFIRTKFLLTHIKTSFHPKCECILPGKGGMHFTLNQPTGLPSMLKHEAISNI